MINYHDVNNLIDMLQDARTRTLDLVRDLSEDQLTGPKLSTVNPLRWEIGHVAYFHEYWILRHLLHYQPLIRDVDKLFDSIHIQHNDRWDLPLPSFTETLNYMQQVLHQEIQQLKNRNISDEARYFYELAVYHEDMHTEAFIYTRQTLSYSAPVFCNSKPGSDIKTHGAYLGDVEAPGGIFLLGAMRDGSFIFDNEKWAHQIKVAPFRIAKAPVTNEQYQEFVEAGGYANKQYWSDEGWRWKMATHLEHPIYWKKEGTNNWLQKNFDEYIPLAPHQPVSHVNWFEAQAYCVWAGRRLPTEAEWEYAAACDPNLNDKDCCEKYKFPWGNHPPHPAQANLDGDHLGCVDVAAFAAGDSPIGCRQMIGNVWEWTNDVFLPYPGFAPDWYKEYSRSLFGTTKVLRGGCWATRSRLMRNTWRNYYEPERNDIFAGFRTCAV